MIEKANKAIEILALLDENGYSLEDLIEAIVQLKDVQKNLKMRICEICVKLGVDVQRKGYDYLIKAIELAYNNDTYLQQLTKTLYPTIGREFKLSSSAIERGIERAIDGVKNNMELKVCKEVFGYEQAKRKKKLTAGRFITAVVKYLQREK